MKKLSIFLLALLLPVMTLTPGCGAAIYQTRKADREAGERAAYSDYRVEMERINLEREKSGLPRSSILTFEEWQARGVRY